MQSHIWLVFYNYIVLSIQIINMTRIVMSTDRFSKCTKICEIVVSVAMPLAIGFTGYLIQMRIGEDNLNHTIKKEISVKLADRRLFIYDQIKQPLNDIYCFIEKVGDWDKMSVSDIRNTRRTLNRVMYSNRAIWSPQTFELYTNYIDKVAFYIDRDNGVTQIRAKADKERVSQKNWHTDDRVFLTEEIDPAHQEAYRVLNESLSGDLLLVE